MEVSMGVEVIEKRKVSEDRDKRREKLLKLLTYEVVDGKPIYYRGYREVLEGKKHPEEVMGSSYIQGKIVATIVGELYSKLKGRYVVATNEVTLIVREGTYRSVDVALFLSEVESEIEAEKWIKLPPVLVIEVDIKAEIDRDGDLSYILLLFSVGRTSLRYGME